MSNTKPYDLESIEIQHGTEIKNSVIWLHGLGADGNDFVPIVKELHLPESLGIRFVFPHAPVMPITINNGYEMRAWFDIISLTREGEIDKKGIELSMAAVYQLIQREEQRGIPSSNIMLGGFSQGAAIAVSAGIRYPNPLAGIIALSGYLPLAEGTLPDAHLRSNALPIFMAHGTQDMVLPLALGKMGYALLQAAGYAVEWHEYPMPHSVCPQELADISTWLQRVLVKNK